MMLDEVEYKNKQQTPNLLQNQLLNFKVVSGVKNTIIQAQISFGKVWKNSYLSLPIPSSYLFLLGVVKQT